MGARRLIAAPEPVFTQWYGTWVTSARLLPFPGVDLEAWVPAQP
ncbi:hypothetical protein ACGFYU_01945 [Streptomyces sp. NPDC048337]